HLKVVVSERERAEIETRAGATGLSVSAYLRNLGLGFQPPSTLDQEAILALRSGGDPRPSQGECRSGQAWRVVQALAVWAKRAVSRDHGDPETPRRHRREPAEAQGPDRTF